jgi:hypothetical protein
MPGVVVERASGEFRLSIVKSLVAGSDNKGDGDAFSSQEILVSP